MCHSTDKSGRPTKPGTIQIEVWFKEVIWLELWVFFILTGFRLELLVRLSAIKVLTVTLLGRLCVRSILLFLLVNFINKNTHKHLGLLNKTLNN